MTHRPNIQIRRPQRLKDTLDERQLTPQIARIKQRLVPQAKHLSRHAPRRPHVEFGPVILLPEEQFRRSVARGADFEVFCIGRFGSGV